MSTGISRRNLTKTLAEQDFVPPNHPLFWHGRLFSNHANGEVNLQPPNVTWESPDKPREDHDAEDWLTASEYSDVESLMKAKIQKLGQLLKLSKKTVVYSGAGISVAAGIGQASRGSKKQEHPHFKINPTASLPTKTHYLLGALAGHGLIHGWVQQNHDGLPQKAGFPQERINEIHGSWYDPSNPVVLYSGSLRSHEYNWMKEEAETADLVLVLGTSLSGLNADQVPINTAYRSLENKALGMVVINLQQTPHDGKASLRIFGSSDDVFQALFSSINLDMPKMEPKVFPFHKKQRNFLVPYDAQGKRIKGNENGTKMCLDLEIGARVHIVNHNIAGAGQPSHKGMITYSAMPQGQVSTWNDRTMGIELRMQPKNNTMILGYFWIEAAIHGRTPTIPVVNIDPTFVSSS